MYGIFTNIYPINHPNVGKYTIHGAFCMLTIAKRNPGLLNDILILGSIGVLNNRVMGLSTNASLMVWLWNSNQRVRMGK